MAVYYGRNGKKTYTLGSRLGGGGEGEVYDISGNSDLVAKIYFDSKFKPSPEVADPRRELKEKIETMLDQPVDPYINGVLSVAWPQDILFDAQGRFVGYIMPRVKSKYHIFAASRERERVQLYPHYSWRTAISIAYNLALAVKVVHRTGAVVGDMNPNNIMIDEKGHVTLIDTDSFNITSRKTGKVYKCSVGVPEMLPPELQGKNLADPKNAFSKETDGFALSIHIFNLLMNNCHPFGCSGLDKSRSSSSNNPVASNIAKGLCPYVSGGSGSTSPDAPDVMMLPKEIRQLFDRAFSYTSRTAIKADTIAKRPSAEEWQQALGTLYSMAMSECHKDVNKHVYPAGYTAQCPWCAIKHPVAVIPGHTFYKSNSGGTKVSANQTSSTKSFIRKQGMSNTLRREAWPLWLSCILLGLISSPFLAQLLVPLCCEYLDFNMSYEAAYIIMGIISAICGGVIAHFGQERYQKAYNGWPWLLLGLLSPLATALATAVIVIAVCLVIMVVVVLFYIVCGCLALAVLWGLITGG